MSAFGTHEMKYVFDNLQGHWLWMIHRSGSELGGGTTPQKIFVIKRIRQNLNCWVSFFPTSGICTSKT